jgi:Cu-processing system permease protein
MSAIAHDTAVSAAPRGRSAFLNVLSVARRELRDAVGSRWFILYTIAFAALAFGVSYVSLASAGSQGLAGFSRTAAGLLNLVMLIVPLMAITAGCASIAGERERGTLLYLLAQPLSRLEIALGKFVGLTLALCASLCMGFGVCAGALALRGGGAGAGVFLTLVGYTCLLAAVMLAVGLLISAASRKSGVATGVGVFTWLTLVFASDLGLMAGALVFRLRVQELFALAMINPLQAFKMGVISQMNTTLDVLGPAGIYATQTFGPSLQWLLVGVLAVWVVAALGLACAVFRWRAPV